MFWCFRIFSPIDIRKLCSKLQTGSRKHTTVYNVNENFYRTPIYNFNVVEVNLRIPKVDKVVLVEARKCNLIKEKTGEEILITSLPKSTDGVECTDCIVMLTNQQGYYVPDSIAVVENFNTNYKEDSKAFNMNKPSINDKTKNSKEI